MKICRQVGALLLHWKAWLATLTPPVPPQYFSLLPLFAPRVTIINTPIHWDLISLSRKTENLFIKSHSCPYCIIPYDIPDWSMNIWFSPSDSFVTNFDVSLNCHKFHISAFRSIPPNFPFTGTHVSSSKKVKHFRKLAFNWRGKWIFHKPSGVLLAVYEVGCIKYFQYP